MKCFFGISNFLEKDFPILLLSSISFHWLLIKAFLSLLAILWNSAFKWVYLSFSPLLLASLLFSAICKASSHNHFAFLHFFFLGMVLITASYAMLQTSVHSSSGTLLDLIPWIYIPRYIQIRALKKKRLKATNTTKKLSKDFSFQFFHILWVLICSTQINHIVIGRQIKDRFPHGIRWKELRDEGCDGCTIMWMWPWTPYCQPNSDLNWRK